jgi:hypothetical protein
VAGIKGELAQECSLRAPVALTEGMNSVDLRVVVGEPLGELVPPRGSHRPEAQIDRRGFDEIVRNTQRRLQELEL